MSLFTVTEYDKKFYEENLKDFLPEKMIDIHTHVWLDSNRTVRTKGEDRGLVTWTSLVAKDNSGDDLAETYKLMFPDKEVTPLIFSSIRVGENFDIHNDYCAECSKRLGQPALYYSAPWMDPDTLEKKILEGGFLGIKAYLDHSPAYIPSDEIRIYDFITPAQLEMLDRIGAIVMCHIPRSKRLGDPVNLAQIVEIDQKYKNLTFIVAHIGRAYCENDFGNGFEVLSKTENVYVDFSANCFEPAMYNLLGAISHKRILFGSDMPILRMRTHRIVENGTYINTVAKGMYGDVSGDSHMREVEGEAAEKITFFMYEEIAAFRRAAERRGLTRAQIEDIFYNNAKGIIDRAKKNLYGE